MMYILVCDGEPILVSSLSHVLVYILFLRGLLFG